MSWVQWEIYTCGSDGIIKVGCDANGKTYCLVSDQRGHGDVSQASLTFDDTDMMIDWLEKSLKIAKATKENS